MMVNQINDMYLAHHGVKGMKWGRRKQRVTENKAARAHFKTERTKTSSNKWQKAYQKKNLNEAKLNSTEVKQGRYRVARARNIKRNAASLTIGAIVGSRAASIAGATAFLTGGAAIPAILAAGGATTLATAMAARKITGASYYGKQKKAYKTGLKRAKENG